MLAEYRDTCARQRTVIEKRQGDIGSLQGRVNDLTYEVKTLLKLKESLDDNHELPDNYVAIEAEEFGFSNTTEPNEETSFEENITEKDRPQAQLAKCIGIASQLTGASHLAKKDALFSDFTLGSLAIDQRRLFGNFQNIKKAVILIYSKKDSQLIFASKSIKGLLGWNSDKFVKNFNSLVQQGMDDWKHTLESIKLDQRQSLRLLLKMRSGKDLLTHCYLGEVGNGNFQGFVIGILKPV